MISIIPARSGSKGLKNKNLKVLSNKPLVAWPIIAALESDCFTEVFVSTDSKEIQEVAIEYGANCPFLRPNELAEDTSSSIDVIFHVLERLGDNGKSFDHICMLEPTSPLTSSKDIQDSFEILNSSRANLRASMLAKTCFSCCADIK